MPAGRVKRPCLGLPDRPCPRFAWGRASRCETCSAEYERAREAARVETRLETEPWRILYTLAAWTKARAARLRLDGRRCVDCGSRQALSVDHVEPLRETWELCHAHGFDLDDFVERATDVELLRTRCASCHKTVDNARRA